MAGNKILISLFGIEDNTLCNILQARAADAPDGQKETGQSLSAPYM